MHGADLCTALSGELGAAGQKEVALGGDVTKETRLKRVDLGKYMNEDLRRPDAAERWDFNHSLGYFGMYVVRCSVRKSSVCGILGLNSQ